MVKKLFKLEPIVFINDIILFSSVAFFPLQIGDHVFIGENSIVNAAVVNSYVYIGKNVTIVSKY